MERYIDILDKFFTYSEFVRAKKDIIFIRKVESICGDMKKYERYYLVLFNQYQYMPKLKLISQTKLEYGLIKKSTDINLFNADVLAKYEKELPKQAKNEWDLTNFEVTF